MSTEIPATCAKCQQPFWQSADPNQRSEWCDVCLGVSSALVPTAPRTTALAIPPSPETLGHFLQRHDVAYHDVQQLIAEGCRPLEDRTRTLWEWLQDRDLRAEQLQKKEAATQAATRMVQQRTTLLREMKGAMLAAGDLENTELENQSQRMRARAGHLRLQAENLELEDELEHGRLLREAKFRTQLMQESAAQHRLRTSVRPVVDDPEAKDRRAIAAERSRLRTKATGKQEVISDFLTEVLTVFKSRRPRTEKALRLRALLETYNQESADLPREVREFLEKAETDHA